MKRKITQADLDKLRARGVTVKSKGIPNTAKDDPVIDTSVADAIVSVGDQNKEVIEALRKEMKALVNKPRGSWHWTINRDNKGRLKSVTADPI
jgi:hypothetical protein